MKQAVLGYKGNRAWTLVLLISVALIPASGFGQIISGDLVVTVYDASGAVVPNATVVALNEATNVKATTSTNPSGEYRFTNLLVGKYDITVSSTRFGGQVESSVCSLELALATRMKCLRGMAVSTARRWRDRFPDSSSGEQRQQTNQNA